VIFTTITLCVASQRVFIVVVVVVVAVYFVIDSVRKLLNISSYNSHILINNKYSLHKSRKSRNSVYAEAEVGSTR
jgi:hypothetical protein